MSRNLRTQARCALVVASLALGTATPAMATELQQRLFGAPASAAQQDIAVKATKFSAPTGASEVSRLQAILRVANDKKNTTKSAIDVPPPPSLLGQAPFPPGEQTVQRLVDPPVLLTEPKVAQRLSLNAPSAQLQTPTATIEVLEKPAAKRPTTSPLDNPFAAEENQRAKHVSRLNRPLLAVGIDTAPTAKLAAQSKKTPDTLKIKNLAASAFGEWDAPAEELTHRLSRYPQGMSIAWAAPASYHRPLYFEQPNLERYGHTVRFSKHGRGLLTQSAVSAAHFFATVPVLPYLIGAEGATCERSYVLGSYRPGSCNPHQLVLPPVSLRGALFQGAATTGLAFFIP